jgi:hypothetical protein
VAIRVTRLDASGNLLTEPGDSYTTSAFLRASFTPEYEEGDEIVEKSADGTVCVSYKAPDTLKRITMELAMCEPDPELTALLSGGLLLRKNFGTFASPDNESIGWAAPAVGDDPAGNGVAIEVWSFAVKDGKRATTNPYFYWVFPYAKLRQSGDRVIENGMLATTFEGYGLGNRNFESGVDGRWEFPVAAERPYSYARASWAPVGLQGFYTWTDNSGDASFFTAGGNIQGQTTPYITSVTAVNTTATVIFSAAHNIATSDKVYVSGTGEPFNTITSGVAATNVNSTAISYTIANVGGTTLTATLDKFSRVSLVDSATEGDPRYLAVTTTAIDTKYANGSGEDTYNVPGNLGYVPDNNVDFIIKSNED